VTWLHPSFGPPVAPRRAAPNSVRMHPGHRFAAVGLLRTGQAIFALVSLALIGCSSTPSDETTRAQNSAVGTNLLQDRSFENAPPRGLTTYDLPWGGEEPIGPGPDEATTPAIEIKQGSAIDGAQFARMLCAPARSGGCGQAFLYQGMNVTPYTDYTFSFWIR